MATLYELSDQFKYLLDLAQSGEIDKETFDDTIASLDLQDDLESKIESYVIVMDELKASNERIDKEIKRLQARKKAQVNNRKRMNETLLDVMKSTETDKVKTDKYTIWYQNNPETVNITDKTAIPKQFYVEQEPKLDRNALKKAVKENDIPGVELQQTQGVRYR